MCGTAAEITPVREVDDRRIGAGQCGPVTRRLQEHFFEVVKGKPGKDPLHPEWLTWLDPQSVLETTPPPAARQPHLHSS